MDKQQPKKTVSEKELKGIVRTSLDSPHPTPAQLARKLESNSLLKGMDLPYLENLPVVEDEATIRPRTAEEVAKRCLATAICAVKGESSDQALIENLIKRYSASAFFSPKEESFIRNTNPTRQQLLDLRWRYECVHVFLWALGHLNALRPPNEICDVAGEASLIRNSGGAFISSAKLRPLSEILDVADLYYRFHWAAVEYSLKGRKSDKLDGEIIQERHRALNWLIRYMNQAWDDVTTDT